MKRKDYQRPVVNIVALAQRMCLLQTSGGETRDSGNASTQDYFVNEEQDI